MNLKILDMAAAVLMPSRTTEKQGQTMKLHVELLGILADRDDVPHELELAAGATVARLMEHLDLASVDGLTFAINGRISRDRNCVLQDGDRILFVPPAVGG